MPTVTLHFGGHVNYFEDYLSIKTVRKINTVIQIQILRSKWILIIFVIIKNKLNTNYIQIKLKF